MAKCFLLFQKKIKIIHLFKNLKVLTWNFSEAGHGKDAPDGASSTLKRTCNRCVANNRDVANFEQFWDCVKEKVKGVTILKLDDCDTKADELENEVASALTVNGSMRVHLVKWCIKNKDYLHFSVPASQLNVCMVTK